MIIKKIIALILLAVLSLQSGNLATPIPSRSEKKLHVFVNKARTKAGLNRLKLSPLLSEAARVHAEAMAKNHKLWHTQVNCWIWGQDVGAGPNAWSIFLAFMHSLEHRKNILGAFNRIGIGTARSSDGALYASLDFCR